jgi:hypothetical protein
MQALRLNLCSLMTAPQPWRQLLPSMARLNFAIDNRSKHSDSKDISNSSSDR